MAEPGRIRRKSLADIADQYRRMVNTYEPGGFRNPNADEGRLTRMFSAYQRAVVNNLSQTREGRRILERNRGNEGNLTTFGVLHRTDPEYRNNPYYSTSQDYGLTDEVINRRVPTRKRRR